MNEHEMIVIKNQKDRDQWQFLTAPAGDKGSGRVRYAAAMYFYGRRMLSGGALEVYRICAKQDHEDPRPALAALGLEHEINLAHEEQTHR